jgi:bifunctional enzyme CysN/CysC
MTDLALEAGRARAAAATKPQVSVVTVGHVDHGKSTLIGRLLHDTGNLADGKVAELRAAAERRKVPFEWSFVLDALQRERDQAITIDTTRIWLRLGEREIVMIDAPGHEEFLRNMVTGASDADAALLVVDAFDGVGEQTRRHALLLELIGVRAVVVAINKMDRVDYARARYEEICAELREVFTRIAIAPLAFVPIAARSGENVADIAAAMPWYDGPTIAGALAELEPIDRTAGDELRLAVQGVFRRGLERIIVGKIEAGTLAAGAEILLSPGARRARVKTLEIWPPGKRTQAHAGESIGFTLDAQTFVERGDLVSHPSGAPEGVTRFRARLLWLGEAPLLAGERLSFRAGTKVARVEVERFERVVDLQTLELTGVSGAKRNDVVEVVLRSLEVLALDTVARHAALGRFILIRGLDVVAGGTVLETLPTASDLVHADHLISSAARAARNGHRGAVIWLTGLPGAGKSTIAMRLERRLFERGIATYVLDGDNVRAGLARDLSFSADDRRENIRRIGEVAALFADAGVVTIAAAISPHRSGRDGARAAAGEAFHEVYIKADSALCESRDPKGHYAKARAGKLSGFTGIDAEYEVPLEPDLVLDTGALSIDESVERIYGYVLDAIRLDRTNVAGDYSL